MRYVLHRDDFRYNSTLGTLYSPAGAVLCRTLEDAHREIKVYGQTCIPMGIFPLGLRTEGEKHEHYALLYPKMHVGMIWIMDVPDFTYTYIHRGNRPKDTLGCVLVGAHPTIIDDAWFVQRSAVTYEHIYPSILVDVATGEAELLVTE